MAHPSGLTEERLASLYDAEGFGGEKTMRAKVIRELIDEIRLLRSELLQTETRPARAPNPEGLAVRARRDVAPCGPRLALRALCDGQDGP